MITRIGQWWLPEQEQHLRQYLENNPDYQKKNRDLALANLLPGLGAIDVGAHCGLWLRDLCDRFDHVWAIEPRDIHRECIERNVPSQNRTVLPYLAGERRGRGSLEIDPENTGHTHYRPGEDIEMIALDDLDYDLKIRFIKIDVEGYELEVLLGARRLIQHDRPRICLEQKPHPLAQGDRYRARDWLIKHDYVPLRHHGDDWVMEWRG